MSRLYLQWKCDVTALLTASALLLTEIGQALLRRNDALTEAAANTDKKHSTQRDSLMKRLTKVIKETDELEKRLAQTTLNLEAADGSNRALLAELEECRRELNKTKSDKARLSAFEDRSRRFAREAEDARQEIQMERRKTTAAEMKARSAANRAAQLADSLKRMAANAGAERHGESGGELHAQMVIKARERLAANRPVGADASQEDETLQALDALAAENEALRRQVDQTTTLLNTANEELVTLREQEQLQTPHYSAPTRPVLGNHTRRTSSGFHELKLVPSSSTAPSPTIPQRELTVDDARSAAGSQPGTPALADELVDIQQQQQQQPMVSRPIPGYRAVSRTSTRSSSIFEHDEPAAGPASSTADTFATTAGSVASGRMTPSGSEAQRIRAAYIRSTSELGDSTPSAERSSPALPSAAAKQRETRTAQLMTLLDFVQRLFARLTTADVDTLTKRLQRQNLTGDVGHLARVTVNGITRDAEGLREHFRKLIEQEARGALAGQKDDSSQHSDKSKDKERESESLVARKEFFALVKLMRDLLFEMAKMKSTINEIQLAPANAAKILQEQLGAATHEDKGVGAWLGKWLSSGLGTSSQPTPAPAASNSGTSGAPSLGLGRPPVSRAGSNTTPGQAVQRSTSRASAAVLSSSTVAIGIKGATRTASDSSGIPHTRSADPTDMADSPPRSANSLSVDRGPSVLRPQAGRANTNLSRVQSKNLTGLFAGAPSEGWTMSNARTPVAATSSSSVGMLGSGPRRPGLPNGGRDRPLSRIVDDDEVSLHQGKPVWSGDGDKSDEEGDVDEILAARARRPRGLSDSSIRSVTVFEAGGPVGLGLSGMPDKGTGHSQRSAPAARIMNRNTLSLSTPSGPSGGGAEQAKQGSTGPPTSSTSAQAAPSQRRGLFAGIGTSLGLPTLRSQTSSTALSAANAAAATNTGSSTASSPPSSSAAAMGVPIGKAGRGASSADVMTAAPSSLAALATSPSGAHQASTQLGRNGTITARRGVPSQVVSDIPSHVDYDRMMSGDPKMDV